MGENQPETQRFSVGRFLERVRGKVGGGKRSARLLGEKKRREREATGRIIEAKEEQSWAAKELEKRAKAGSIGQVLDVSLDGTVGRVLYEVRPAEEFPSPEQAEEERKKMARLVASGLVWEYRGGEGRRRHFVDEERARKFENLQEALRWVDKRASERRRKTGEKLLHWLEENGCRLEMGPINAVNLRVKRWVITGPRGVLEALCNGLNQGRYIEGFSNKKELQELRELIVETERGIAGTGEASLILTQAGEVAIGKARQGTFDSYPEEMIPGHSC